MSEIRCEFFGTEDGEPWCAFAYGHLPPETLADEPVRSKILREAAVFDFDPETCQEIEEAMQGAPQHLWITAIGEVEDNPMFQFCTAEAEGAVAITGWRLR